jgi:hypothetical protein
VRSEQASPLSAAERALLDALLAHEFPGVRQLREQALHVRAKRGCECGCGTIEFVSDGTSSPRSAVSSPAPVEGLVYDTDGDEIGGLILFLKGGMLQSLEIYSYDQPLPLPSIDRVTWRA